MLVRRMLVCGLAVMLVLGAVVPAVGATALGVADAAPVRDIAGPAPAPERDAVVAEPAADGSQPASTGSKPSAPGDGQRQGSVVAVFLDPIDPLIVIAVGNGYLTVRLRCGSLCPNIHLGDYVVAEGHRRSEAVFDAVEVWVVSP